MCLKTYILVLNLLISAPIFSQSLDSYRWKNRLVVLIAETENKKLGEQKELFDQVKNKFAQRDMLLLERNKNDEELVNQFRLSPNFEGVILLGKDGGLKLKKPFLVEPQSIFELIDSMPMRRSEMRKQKGN